MRIILLLAALALAWPAWAGELPKGLIKVEANVAATRTPERGLVFGGTTNLPSGTKLMVDFGTDKGQLLAREVAVVAAGTYRTGAFFANGQPLPAGAYRVRVTTMSGSEQPPHVTALAGPRGEKLTGPLVQAGREGRTLLLQNTVHAP